MKSIRYKIDNNTFVISKKRLLTVEMSETLLQMNTTNLFIFLLNIIIFFLKNREDKQQKKS